MREDLFSSALKLRRADGLTPGTVDPIATVSKSTYRAVTPDDWTSPHFIALKHDIYALASGPDRRNVGPGGSHRAAELDLLGPELAASGAKRPVWRPDPDARPRCYNTYLQEQGRCSLSAKDAGYRAIMAPGMAGIDVYNGLKAIDAERRYNEDCQFQRNYQDCLTGDHWPMPSPEDPFHVRTPHAHGRSAHVSPVSADELAYRGRRRDCQSLYLQEKEGCREAVKEARYKAFSRTPEPLLDVYNGWKAGRLERRTNGACYYEANYERCLSDDSYYDYATGRLDARPTEEM